VSAPQKGQKIAAIECDVYSRVVGYYRPVQNWNKGKREEFRQRHVQGYQAVRAAAEKGGE
jgi:anaerobic ribonucleoside-triphosphate reductase